MEENLDFMNILWNTYNYRETYTTETERPEELNLEDRWILSRLNTLVEEVKDASTEPRYEGYKAAKLVEEFTKNDLSRGYVKMVRDRLRPGYDGEDRKAAEWTVRHVTTELLKVLAPFTPFLAEYLYEGETVHLEEMPEIDEEVVNEELELSMDIYQDIEEAVARLRQENGISLRHPVKKVTVSGDENVSNAVNHLEDLMENRLNAREVEFEQMELDHTVKLDYEEAGPELGDAVGEVEQALAEEDHDELAADIEEGTTVELAGHELGPEMFDVRTSIPEGMEGEEFSKGAVYLDTERTEELLDEAFVNEVIRAVQQERKEAGLDVEDSVHLNFTGDTSALEEFEDRIESRVNVTEI
ncbi:MAG: class I tRNA ligase family protein, partial [Candidatus Nanohaloarchaea archaeon]